MPTTVTDSLTHSVSAHLSDLTPAADPAELQERLDIYATVISDLMTGEMKRIITEYGKGLAATITAAATDDAELLQPLGHQWVGFVEDQIGPIIASTYLEGALSTTLTSNAPGRITDLMAPVINQSAVDYTRTATNRIAGAGTQMWGNVRSELTNTIANGGTVEDLKSQVEKITGYSEFRADTIARTEVMGAYNHGDDDAATSLGEYGPVEKQWLAAIDNRTRESHIEANGQVVPFKEDFLIGGYAMPFPGEGPPEEVINCRCVVLHLYPGDERPDGTLAGEDPLDREGLARPAPPPEETKDWIRGQLDANPKMTGQQLLDQFRAEGKTIARQDFYKLVRETKSGNVGETVVKDVGKVGERKTGIGESGLRRTQKEIDQRAGKVVYDDLETAQRKAKERIAREMKQSAEKQAEAQAKHDVVHRTNVKPQPGERRMGLRRGLSEPTGKSAVFDDGYRPSAASFGRGVPSDRQFSFASTVDGGTASQPGMKNAVAFRHRGVTIVVDDVDPYWLAKAQRGQDYDFTQLVRRLRDGNHSVDQAIQAIDNVLDQVPNGTVKQVNLFKGQNPADAYWAKQYNIPNFTSAATGGDAEVNVYMGRPPSYGTMRHEVGHNIESIAEGYHGVSGTQAWSDAMVSDAGSYPMAKDGKPVRLSNRASAGHPPTPTSPKGITNYGQSSPAEDFAEAFRLYLTDRDLGYLGESRQRFAELFPARAKLIEETLAKAATKAVPLPV